MSDDIEDLLADLESDAEELDSDPLSSDERDPMTKSVGDFGASFKDNFKNDKLGQVKKIVGSSIPKHLSEEVNFLKETKDQLESVYSDNVKDLKSGTKELVDNINSKVPNNAIFKNVFNKLSSALGSNDPDKQYGKGKEPTEDEVISNNINRVFETDRKRRQVDEIVSEMKNSKRFNTEISVLNNILGNLAYTNRFNDDVTDKYYRKSLELKYKSLFIGKQQLEVTKAGFDLFKTQLEALVKNTALPDIVKVRGSELVGETLNARIREGIADSFYSTDNPLMKFKNNLISKAKDAIDGVKTGLDTTNSVMEMQNTMSDMGASTATMAGAAAGDKLKSMMGDKIGSFLSKNEKAKKIMHAVKAGMLDPGEALSELANEQFKKGTSFGNASSSLLRNLGSLAGNGGYESRTFQQLDGEDASIFDNRTKNAIIKTIPGLLSKILAEVEEINTGERKSEYFYDEVSGGLARTGEVENKISERAERALESAAGYNLESFVQSVSGASGSEISSSQATSLKQALVTHLIKGGSISPTTLVKDSFTDLLDLPDDEKEEIKNILKSTQEKSTKDLTLFENLANSMSSTRNNIPIIDNQISEFHKGGQIKYAEEIGLVDYDDVAQKYTINKDRYIEILNKSISNLKAQEIQKDENGNIIYPKGEDETPNDPMFNTEEIKKSFKEAYTKTKTTVQDSKIYKDAKEMAVNVGEEIKKTDMYKDVSENFDEFKKSDAYIKAEEKILKIKGMSKEDAEKLIRDTISKDGRTKLKEDTFVMFNKLGEQVNNKWENFDLHETLNENLTDEQKDMLNEKLQNTKQFIDENEIIQNTLTKAKNIDEKYGVTGKAKTAKEYVQGGSQLLRDEMLSAKENLDGFDLNSIKEMDIQEFISRQAMNGVNGTNDIYKAAKSKAENLTMEDVKNSFNGVKLDIKDALMKKEIDVEDLYELYNSSKESLTGIDFLTWSSNLGFKLGRDKFVKDESNAEERSRMSSIKSSLIDNFEKVAGKIDEKDEKPVTRFDKIRSGLKKAREIDSKVAGAVLGSPKALFEFLLKKKKKDVDDTEEEKKKKKKPIFGDKDGDGDRDGGWKDILQSRKNKKNDKPHVEMESKPRDDGKKGILGGIWDLLKGALPFLGTIAGGVTSLIGGIGGVTKAVGGLGTLLVGAKNLAGGALAAATGMKMFGGKKDEDTDKKKKKKKKKTKMKGKKIAPGKILSTLRSFERRILAKFSGTAGKRILAMLTGKIAARLVPVVGLGILAYDAIMIGKDMLTNGTSLHVAASNQVLGFNIFGTDTPVDENGNHIKTGEDIEKEKIQDALANLERRDADINDRIADISDDGEKGTMRSSKRDIYENALDKIHGRDKFNRGSGLRNYVREKYDSFKGYMNQNFGSIGRLMNKTENYFKTGSFKNNPDKKEVFEIIDKAAERTGVDKNILKTFAALESGFNPNAKAKTSSAKGLFQFINGTWKSMINKHGEKYGLDGHTNPYDPMASSLMGAEYIKQNEKILSDVKDNIGVVDLYMAHFLGPYGAKKFFKASPGEIAAGILPKAARANRSIFFNKRREPRTVSEVYNYMQSKLMRQSKDFGFSQDIKPIEKREEIMASAKSKLETVNEIKTEKAPVAKAEPVSIDKVKASTPKTVQAETKVPEVSTPETKIKEKISDKDLTRSINEKFRAKRHKPEPQTPVEKFNSENRRVTDKSVKPIDTEAVKSSSGIVAIGSILEVSLGVTREQLEIQKSINNNLINIHKSIIEGNKKNNEPTPTPTLSSNSIKEDIRNGVKVSNSRSSVSVPKSVLNGKKVRFG